MNAVRGGREDSFSLAEARCYTAEEKLVSTESWGDKREWTSLSHFWAAGGPAVVPSCVYLVLVKSP